MGNQVNFQIQRSVCDLKFLSKSYGQITEKRYDNVWTLNVFWTLFITFEWRIQITNKFLEVKVNLISYNLSTEFNLEKVDLSCVNEIWNYPKHIIIMRTSSILVGQHVLYYKPLFHLPNDSFWKTVLSFGHIMINMEVCCVLAMFQHLTP
jgi:hypothetical protein